MIPMPGDPPEGESSPQVTRQLSPSEERNVLLNFMGNMYGEANKMDNNIIGEATTLKRGSSNEIKKQIEQVYTQPQQPVPQQVQAAIPQPEPQPQVEVKQPDIVTEIQPIDDTQLSFNFNTTEKDQLFELVEKVSSRLDRLHRKVDNLTEIVKNTKVTSLPIKRQTKKKSVDKKEEV